MTGVITAVLYFVKDFSACTALLMIFRFIFLEKIRLKKLPVIGTAAMLAAAAFAGILLLPRAAEDYDSILDFVSNILYIIILFLFSESRKISRCIWTVLLCTWTADMFYSLFGSVLPKGLICEYAVNILLYSLLCLWLWLFAAKAKINFLPRVFEEIPKWVYAVIMLFELTCYYKEFGLSSDWYKILYIFSSAAVVLCILYLMFKIFYVSYQQNLILQQMAEQKIFGEQAVKGDEELRRFRHDYKNHMIVVNAYLENGKTDEARAYLLSVNDSLNGVINKIRTGNFVADAILNNKSVAAGKKGISIEFDGFIPPDGIKDEDLTTVISNLTDNAVEACEKLGGEAKIEIEANVSNGFFVFSITNPTSGETSGGLFTTKSDTKNHGFGIKNVKRVVERYNGFIITGAENGVFSADLRMKVKKDINAKKTP